MQTTPTDPVALMNWRHLDRLHELAEDWEDEASKMALAGKPKRAHYISDFWARGLRESVHNLVGEHAIGAQRAIKR